MAERTRGEGGRREDADARRRGREAGGRARLPVVPLHWQAILSVFGGVPCPLYACFVRLWNPLMTACSAQEAARARIRGDRSRCGIRGRGSEDQRIKGTRSCGQSSGEERSAECGGKQERRLAPHLMAAQAECHGTLRRWTKRDQSVRGGIGHKHLEPQLGGWFQTHAFLGFGAQRDRASSTHPAQRQSEWWARAGSGRNAPSAQMTNNQH